MGRWWSVMLLLAAGTAQAQVAWRVVPAVVLPGGTAQVAIEVRHAGELLPGANFRIIVQGAAVYFASQPPAQASSGVSCGVRSEFVADGLVVSPPDAGDWQLACRVTVQAGPHAVRGEARISVYSPCTNAGSPCTPVAQGAVRVDGPAHWSERSLIVVPRAAGPSRETLAGFDYADTSTPAPLRMFEQPRPTHVESAMAPFPAGNAYAKGSVPPNAAVAAVLRAVRAIYADEAARLAAQANAAADPQVEGIGTDTGFGLRTWPPQPRAGEPFALWYTTYLCSPVVPQHPDEREVTVQGAVIGVAVPNHQFVDFAACPGGEIQALLNMPGVAAGRYRLDLGVLGESGPPDTIASAVVDVLPAGSASAVAPRAVPAASAPALVALLLAMLAGVRGAAYSRRCS